MSTEEVKPPTSSVTPIADKIRNRLLRDNVQFFANDSIHEHIKDSDREPLQKEVEGAVLHLLNTLLIDTTNDHNSKDTAKRLAKMYIKEVMHGRYQAPPSLTSFPNARKLDEIYTTGPISIRSMCSHHWAPIIGEAWIGVIPGDKVIGLSKFNRITDWIMSRPQIQEEAVIMLADELEKALNPLGLAVVIRAKHFCMCWRGVKENNGSMVNSVVRGVFAKNPNAKQEFFSLIAGQGY